MRGVWESLTYHILDDLSRPVHRYLLEQKWRKQGALDLVVSSSCELVLNETNQIFR